MAKIIGDELRTPTISEVNEAISNIDNTSDLNKPISNAAQEALNNKANLEHTHKYSTILDTPTALKNPEPLIIQGNEYDGSVRTEINIQNSSSNVIEGGGVISEVVLDNSIVTGIIPLNFNITQYGIIKFDKLYKDSIFFDNYSNVTFSSNIQRILVRKNIKEINIGIENYVDIDMPPSKFNNLDIIGLKILDGDTGELKIRLLSRVSENIVGNNITIFESSKGDIIRYTNSKADSSNTYTWYLTLAD